MALAGGAKLADPDGSRRAFEGFGVTGGLAKIGPVLLSVIEIALAVLLIFPQTSWYGAIGALVLLLLFIAQMAYQLAKGNSPDCHCFGQVYSAPVSTISIVRNVVFAIPAAVLAARGQTGQGAGITDPGVNTLELVFGVVITALLLVATAYLRKISQRQDRILKELEVPPSPATAARSNVMKPVRRMTACPSEPSSLTSPSRPWKARLCLSTI